MNNYFDKKITHNQISFSYSRKARIDEREIHTYHEILYYIDGDAEFSTVRSRHKLRKGTVILIPGECYHYVSPASPDKFKRLKISIPHLEEFEEILSSVMSEIRIIEEVPASVLYALKRICSSFDISDGERARLSAYGAFLILISELAGINAPIEERTRDRNHIISRCIEIIDSSMTESIRISDIARELNVSESALSHNFRKEIGISFHKYISQRRLVHARRLLESNEKPTKIYAECGYSDYSSFYKAYIKLYGHPPSEKK